MNEKEEEKIERNIDLYIQISLNYWTALLTMNTIIIAVFSALSVFYNYNIFITAIIIFAIISSLFLILNFKIVKNMYYELGLMAQKNNPSQNEVNELNQKAKNGYKKNNLYTLFSEIALFIELVFINIVIASS